jgi:hypothetical protein
MKKRLCFAVLSLIASIPLAAQLVTIPSAKPSSVIHSPDEPAPVIATAAPPAPWAAKRIAQWSDQDAYQILSNSPWSKQTAASLTRLMTADQRRAGGDMDAQGGGHGGIGVQNAGSLVGTGGAIKRPGEGPEAMRLPKLTIRWESAMPVQAAELRTHDNSAPELDGEDYAICVYNLNLKLASIEDMKTIDKDLNRLGVLKIEGRDDIHPRKTVTVLMGDGVANVIYFFPRAAHITAQDQRLEFQGQVGRIVFGQYFYPPEMKFLGKLEL